MHSSIQRHSFSILILLILIVLGSTAHAVETGTVRAQGMAGSYTALAEGNEAILWNPANLAFHNRPDFTLEFFSGAAKIANNGIGLDMYNQYSGAVLQEEDKRTILDAIPNGGLSTNADVNVSALGMQWRQMAFSVNGHASLYSNLPHDMFALLLQGNAVMDSVSFSDADGEAIGLVSLNLAGATRVGATRWGQVHVGANLRYLKGLAYGKLNTLDGYLTTSPQSIQGETVASMTTAGAGNGLGMDVGLAAQMGSNWRMGMNLENLFARIHFSGDVENRWMIAQSDSINIASVEEAENEDDLIVTEEIVEEGGAFTVSLPRILHLGFARMGNRSTWAFEYRQGFSTRAGSSTTPRISVGNEVRLLSWLPLRWGMAIGGSDRRSASVGLGLALFAFRLDVAAATHGEFLPGDPKGMTLAAGMGLRF